MLSDLYQYAIDHNLAALPGFKPKKNVKAHVHLGADGAFFGFVLHEKSSPPIYAPDIGSAAQGPRFCNPLIEKAKIPLNIVVDREKDRNIPLKHNFFLSMLDDGSAVEPIFGVVATALRNTDVVAQIVASMEDNKLKPGDMIGFSVDGMPLESCEMCYEWWSGFRTQFAGSTDGPLPRCLITSELRPHMETVPKVSGLMAVGGHSAGDALLCFDKAAYQSYGFEKSENATVSEEAMVAVNAAITDLIGKAPRPYGKSMILHWYTGAEISDDEDAVPMLFDGELIAAFEDDENDTTDSATEEAEAIQAANRVFTAIHQGIRPEALGAHYHILSLSGANGRMMVRSWQTGRYETLHANIVQWFDDLSLVSWNGKGMAKLPKLKALAVRLLKPGGDPRKVFSRMDDEIPNLLHRLFYSAINGTAIPDEVPIRVLHWLRSALLKTESEEGKTSKFTYEAMAFQLLKAWLCRKQRMRGDTNIMQASLNPTEARSVAYHCGQLMSIYVGIQQDAFPNMGAGIAERYYASASSSPALVLGKLAQLSQHHLCKLNPGLARRYERMISDVMTLIGDRAIPTVTSVEEQTEFAIGYYQQRAVIYAPSSKPINNSDTEE